MCQHSCRSQLCWQRSPSHTLIRYFTKFISFGEIVPIHRSINHALRDIRLKTRTKMMAEVKRQQVDFSPLEHKAMSDIAACEGASQQTLVVSMSKDKAQIARVVARLLRQDLITKHGNPDDKRAVLLALTERGQQLLACLDKVEMEIVNDMLEDFSEEESQLFCSLLHRVNHNLK
ncbi:MarR family winged helix-turn-helix transcriptional regulator [Agarivorans sp. 1_MG-2023]|uniref:MarR family winged helix-turn-helix transcriptional regulator n=1 Tax=Agarivorans sp. 1_MG-2023 TaxID=3062634 RepID=UPI0026E44BED|nr:MarR family transcriptional regulator [Agarivorans sp. 1_MG-2023]MDO6763631.1 MarR family transcriptional regulator [Agarivorans sp. 1_MG-2023]